jgi:hypothetical protein
VVVVLDFIGRETHPLVICMLLIQSLQQKLGSKICPEESAALFHPQNICDGFIFKEAARAIARKLNSLAQKIAGAAALVELTDGQLEALVPQHRAFENKAEEIEAQSDGKRRQPKSRG